MQRGVIFKTECRKHHRVWVGIDQHSRAIVVQERDSTCTHLSLGGGVETTVDEKFDVVLKKLGLVTVETAEG